jgi:hypothetical protein
VNSLNVFEDMQSFPGLHLGLQGETFPI